jgi:hypothetical protein
VIARRTFIQLVFVGSKRPLNVTVSSICGDKDPVMFRTGILRVATEGGRKIDCKLDLTGLQRAFRIITGLRTARWSSCDIHVGTFHVGVDEQCLKTEACTNQSLSCLSKGEIFTKFMGLMDRSKYDLYMETRSKLRSSGLRPK